jgi:hypothetical protein
MNLIKRESMVRAIFDKLVQELETAFPDFGKNLAGDGKALDSLSKKGGAEDKRGEKEADWGVKTYSGIDKDGRAWKKIKSWFGFKLHLIVDANAELPVAYEVTKASKGEQPVMEELLDRLNENHPVLVERCEHFMLDKGYDSTDIINKLWKEYGIKPVIDIRDMWKDGEKTRQMKTIKADNVTYDYRGTVFCHCPKTGEMKQMAYGGFEEKRSSLKYLCPAGAYGMKCEGCSSCSIFKKSIRIPLKEDRRIFTPLARSSYKWQDSYNKRTSVERVNSRLDVSFGFEHHYIRGLLKMKVRCGLALCVMLAIAVGRIRQNRQDLMRSLVKAA